MSWWRRRRLRARILLPFAALIVAVLIATLWAVGAAVTGWVERSLRQQFDVTGEVFQALMAERAECLLDETWLLSADFALKRAIATYDPETLGSVAQNQRDRLGVALLWITDEKGTVLAAAGGGEVGSSALDVPPLGRVMETSEAAVAVTEVGGLLLQVVATPVLAPDPIGFLLAGESIDDELAETLAQTTGATISFLAPGRVFASSWPESERSSALAQGQGPLAEQLARDTDAHSTFLVNMSGARLLSLLIPIRAELPQSLFVLVQAPYDATLGPLAALPQWVTAIGAVALVIALLIGGLIAAGIAAPLRALAVAMGQVLAGDLSQRIELDRQDEVGFLARAFNAMVAGLAERERIKDTFGRFVSREVADAVLSADFPLDGERREVTILFQDVRGFTTIAERLAPDVLIRVVNRLFTEMVAAVEAQGGVVRQFLGDGVMAMFGAPIRHDDDPSRAVRAALDMIERLPALNERLSSEGLPTLRLSVGIHTGEVVVGRVGPDERSEYGIVGDAVNVASRIESLTRELDVTILASAETASRLDPSFELGRRTTAPVRGKAQPIEVVEVLGRKRS